MFPALAWESIDGAQLHPSGGTLTVSNIGSSGQDGVSIDLDENGDGSSSSNHRSQSLNIRVNRIDMAIAAPLPPGSTAPKLRLEATGEIVAEGYPSEISEIYDIADNDGRGQSGSPGDPGGFWQKGGHE